MGSPLSPTLANIVMQDLELKAINNLNIGFLFYFRYVHDIVLYTSEYRLQDILNTFNIHPRLQFTLSNEKKIKELIFWTCLFPFLMTL